jgi:diketogulonate reductase-like aldo/keto reductase
VKSTSSAHLHANVQVGDFTISKDDMEKLDSWDKKLEGSIRMHLKRIPKTTLIIYQFHG